ncbi:chromosome segregation DNA-binding protein [Frankineae bacterium MT45]|nr:chromosome segregation DNA-binding protein [Frankineae bacterium MT45]
MSEKRRGGLGRGIGALIPTAPPVPTPPVSAPAADAPPVPAPPVGASTLPAAAGSPTAQPSGSQPGAEAAPIATDAQHAQELAEVPGAAFAELPVAEIHPNAHQPRQVFDEQALEELTHSIREFGVLQPVVVRVDPAGGYELVMGERRLRASTAAGLTEIPAIIRSTADDAMLRDALLENIHRSALNPLEEAAAYQQLLEEFGVTHDELARRIGRSRSQVSNTIRLMNLSVPVQRRVAAGVLSAGHARALLGLEDHEQQDELAGRIVAEGLSVRATEELVTLAAHEKKPAVRRGPTKRITAPAIAELAEKLSDTLDTRVRVDLGKRKGKITVEFGSIDDLERIVAAIAPQLATRPTSG